MEPTEYHQILAEQYEENSRNLLVYQREYEEDDVDEHEDHDYEKQDLPDKEDFNKFAGNRNKEEYVTKSKAPFDDKGKNSVRYQKDVKNLPYNIDSRFRDGVVTTTSSNTLFPQSSTNFIFRLSKLIKNVKSVKLTSLEFPNTFFTFSNSRGNNTFTVTVGGVTKRVFINEGNYLVSGSKEIIDVAALALAFQTGLVFAFPSESFLVSYGATPTRVTISNGNIFTLTFSTTSSILNGGITAKNRNNGVGYFLGYQNYQYSGSNSYTGEVTPQLIGDAYIYLAISDWDNVKHENYTGTNFLVYAKILLASGKGSMVFDTPITNPTSKEYFFSQPLNISVLQIKFLDSFGTIIDLDGANVSMTLEFSEILNMNLYESLNNI